MSFNVVFQGRHFCIFVSDSSLFTESWSSPVFQIALSSHLQMFMIYFLLFPLTFLVLISVFYDSDCVIRNWLPRLPISLCQPWSQPLRARACACRTGGQPCLVCIACPHVEMHRHRRKSSRWTLMSCWRTSCWECVVAGGCGVGSSGRKENQVLTTYLTDRVPSQLFTKVSVVLKCFPA